ncbi:unnamed protein product [Fusarium equiseti]|uniref:NACHT domain-containing protein n=1 Tax=Fusarium equiseti TaxID=61235 RepID=A0A8J2N8C2_FUSEQ|nr:unnamed protein product [Fusarium equiseti]
MSGAEVLAGIGILCNAMQIVTFGKDALEVYNHVRENGTVDPRLESYLADSATSYQEMKKQLFASGPLTSDQQEIVRIGEGAHNGLEKFRTYFTTLYVDENSRKGFRGKLRVAKSSLNTLFRAKELEDLAKNFERYQQLFQTRLIQRVCGQGDAAALLIQESFTYLNSTQQSMVRKIAQGHTEMSLLVSQKAVEVRDHVTNQHEETRSALGKYLSITEHNLHSYIADSTSVIRQDMTSRHDTEHQVRKYDQLMASLRYPEMNTRKCQVVENFPKTFQWILSNKGPSDYDNSSSESDSSGEDSGDEEDTDGGIGRVSQGHSDSEGKSDGEFYEGRHEAPGSGANQEERTSRELYDDDTSSTASRPETSVEFTKWLGSESKMFWISGKPGSGKSTLMKFIATNSAIPENMAAWRSDVHILSHYFWKAGHPMERNLKGLLLSLTYQVLLDRMALAQRLWGAMPAIRHKWSYGDWDMQQLENTLFWVLEAAEKNFLLLIDGLDESEELEKHVYMTDRNKNILDRLANLKDVKICVSSREEYTFSHHFQDVRKLRIHDFTKHDIRRLTNSRLKRMNFANSNDRERILQRIAAAADGVFLWVVLVLDSVVRAFRLDNNLERLLERIQKTPRDLIALVRDIWMRSGEDVDVPSYRACASRYFSLALARDGWLRNGQSILRFTLALASGEHALEGMLDLNHTWDLLELAKLCSKTENEICVVCSGLLEIVVSTKGNVLVPELLQPYEKMGVRFTHRCVIDFLRDTVDGSTLLKACEWRQGEALARKLGASMIFHRLFPDHLVSLKPVSGYSVRAHNGHSTKKQYILPQRYHGHVEGILQRSTNPSIPVPYQSIFLRKSYEWYMAKTFTDRIIWGCSGGSIFRHDPLKNGFFASMAKSASPSVMEKLIAALSVKEFLNALPAVFLGISTDLHFGNIAIYRGWQEEERSDRLHRLKRSSLTYQVLTRLLRLQEDECNGYVFQKASTGETRHDLQLLVCSWFLGTIDTESYEKCDDVVRNLDLEVLQLIKLTLPTPEDWDQSVLLFLRSKTNQAKGFMHFDPGRTEWCDSFVLVNLVTIYQIFLGFVQRSVSESQSVQRTPITAERLPDIWNRKELSLRIVLIMGDRYIAHICREENQHQDSQLLLDSLLTGRHLTAEEIATVKGRKGRVVVRDYESKSCSVASYLIAELGHISGLPMHPWSAWLVDDVSEHGEAEDLHVQVDEKSRELLKEIIEEVSQDL